MLRNKGERKRALTVDDLFNWESKFLVCKFNYERANINYHFSHIFSMCSPKFDCESAVDNKCSFNMFKNETLKER